MDHKIYEKQGKTCTYYHMRFNSGGIEKYEKVLKLREFLYKDATIYLKRKKDKIDAYLEYRANHISKKDMAV